MNNCFLYPEKESKYADLLHKEGLRYEDIDAMTNEQKKQDYKPEPEEIVRWF